MDHSLSFYIPIWLVTLASSISVYVCLLSFPFGFLSLNLSLKIKKGIRYLKGKEKKNGVNSWERVNEQVEEEKKRKGA